MPLFAISTWVLYGYLQFNIVENVKLLPFSSWKFFGKIVERLTVCVSSTKTSAKLYRWSFYFGPFLAFTMFTSWIWLCCTHRHSQKATTRYETPEQATCKSLYKNYVWNVIVIQNARERFLWPTIQWQQWNIKVNKIKTWPVVKRINVELMWNRYAGHAVRWGGL